MNRTSKIILAIVGVLAVLCCLGVLVMTLAGGWFANSMAQGITDDPAKAAELGKQIVEYEVPDGYEEKGGMDMMGFRMVIIGPENKNAGLVLMLMGLPNMGGDPDAMRQQMEQSLGQSQGGSSGNNITWTSSEEEEMTIRGQDVTVLIQEGEDEAGDKFKQLSGVFEGPNGVVMLMALSPLDDWDDEVVAAFIESIK